MNTSISRLIPPHHAQEEAAAHLFRLKFRTLEMPCVRDGVIIGTEAPVSPQALLAIFAMTTTEPFSLLLVSDNIVRAVIIRQGLLKRMHGDFLADLIVARVKPFMSASEVLRLDVEMDTLLEAAL